VGRPEPANAFSGQRSQRASPVAEYDYTDEDGQVLYQTVRYQPKDFRQRQPNSKGGWLWNLKDVRLVLYRLTELLKCAAETVFICEGEKDVDALAGLGLLATCNPMGAGKWRDQYAETLRGRRVVVITDNDPPTDEKGKPHYKGQRHAATVSSTLLRHDCEVRIVEPPRGKDVSDWLAAGGTVEEIERLVRKTDALTPATLGAWTKCWSHPHCALVGGAATASSVEWPAPLPIQSELPAVQPFCQELLPMSFRSLVRDVAERMQVPMDYPAVVILLCLAGVVSRRAVIQPKGKRYRMDRRAQPLGRHCRAARVHEVTGY
jgi:hypothetical protein